MHAQMVMWLKKYPIKGAHPTIFIICILTTLQGPPKEEETDTYKAL